MSVQLTAFSPYGGYISFAFKTVPVTEVIAEHRAFWLVNATSYAEHEGLA